MGDTLYIRLASYYLIFGVELNSIDFSTLRAPCRKTQVLGVLESSVSLPESEGSGSTRCLEKTGGLEMSDIARYPLI